MTRGQFASVRNGARNVEQERLLQLAHVGVEAPVGLPVPLDVEEEHPPPAGFHLLCPADESEERARRFLEPLVREHDMAERHAAVVDRRHRPSRLVHGAVSLLHG